MVFWMFFQIISAQNIGVKNPYWDSNLLEKYTQL